MEYYSFIICCTSFADNRHLKIKLSKAYYIQEGFRWAEGESAFDHKYDPWKVWLPEIIPCPSFCVPFVVVPSKYNYGYDVSLASDWIKDR